MFEKNYGMIIACDVDSLDALRLIVEMSHGQEGVVGYKIGFSLALRFGLKEIAEIARSFSNLPVVYDHQKAGTDIPQMGEPFAKCCSDCGMNGVIIFPQAGPKTLRAFVKAIAGHDMTPIVGGMMTHPGYLQSDGGFIADAAPSAIYREALNLGVTHFVLPGNRPDDIRQYVTKVLSQGRDTLSLLMPGIGSQGGQIQEAFDAAAGHRCYAIVGSAIYGASDPLKALLGFTEQVKSYAPPIGPARAP